MYGGKYQNGETFIITENDDIWFPNNKGNLLKIIEPLDSYGYSITINGVGGKYQTDKMLDEFIERNILIKI